MNGMHELAVLVSQTLVGLRWSSRRWHRDPWQRLLVRVMVVNVTALKFRSMLAQGFLVGLAGATTDIDWGYAKKFDKGSLLAVFVAWQQCMLGSTLYLKR
jgi:hypothetical protein